MIAMMGRIDQSYRLAENCEMLPLLPLYACMVVDSHADNMPDVEVECVYARPWDRRWTAAPVDLYSVALDLKGLGGVAQNEPKEMFLWQCLSTTWS